MLHHAEAAVPVLAALLAALPIRAALLVRVAAASQVEQVLRAWQQASCEHGGCTQALQAASRPTCAALAAGVAQDLQQVAGVLVEGGHLLQQAADARIALAGQQGRAVWVGLQQQRPWSPLGMHRLQAGEQATPTCTSRKEIETSTSPVPPGSLTLTVLPSTLRPRGRSSRGLERSSALSLA